ncbi:right-handed parallel beta-helix repeat-containing protein [Sandaracinobacteroides hominis]|uniref:right-handed parallel beta-helix repeat-containing protein n=1 Tax=Sandaracinobacteroides hominis TaxID=2780086 RepID=UPI0018F3B80D|nr:right-handed parallel beta-helix repeat-containing protein [Sandaracinobacteroides hominis]
MPRTALFALLLATAGPATAATYTVANPAELAAAIKAVRAGDTILLAPGDYGTMRIFRRRITDGRVHITSADGANRARVSTINLEGSEGFLVSRLVVQGSTTPLVNITGAPRNIAFHDNLIQGANANLDPWDDNNTAVYIRGANTVTFTQNQFRDLKTAMYVQNSFDVIISQNSFTYLREGLNIASLGRGDIVGNLFHSFYPRYDKSEHPDAIQLWTRGESWGSHDLSIRNNYFALGGPRMVHGIFGRSEEAESYGRPVYFARLTITGNVYYGSALHGITLSSVNGAEVSNNVVVASPTADINNSNLKSPDGGRSSGGGLLPQIRLVNGTDIRARNNVATSPQPAGTGVTSTDHIKIYDPVRKTGEPWTSVFAARPTAEVPPLSAFLSLPGTAAHSRGIGLLSTFQAGHVAPAASPLRRGDVTLGAMPAKP